MREAWKTSRNSQLPAQAGAQAGNRRVTRLFTRRGISTIAPGGRTNLGALFCRPRGALGVFPRRNDTVTGCTLPEYELQPGDGPLPGSEEQEYEGARRWRQQGSLLRRHTEGDEGGGPGRAAGRPEGRHGPGSAVSYRTWPAHRLGVSLSSYRLRLI